MHKDDMPRLGSSNEKKQRADWAARFSDMANFFWVSPFFLIDTPKCSNMLVFFRAILLQTLHNSLRRCYFAVACLCRATSLQSLFFAQGQLFRCNSWHFFAPPFFLGAFQRRVLSILGVCHTFSHLRICASFSHLQIYAFQLHIFTFSHLHTHILFSHRHTLSSAHFHLYISFSHLHIRSFSHLRSTHQLLLFTASLFHICAQHLLVFTPSFLHIHTCACRLHIFTSSHFHTYSSSHLRLLFSPHLHRVTCYSHSHLHMSSSHIYIVIPVLGICTVSK